MAGGVLAVAALVCRLDHQSRQMNMYSMATYSGGWSHSQPWSIGFINFQESSHYVDSRGYTMLSGDRERRPNEVIVLSSTVIAIGSRKLATVAMPSRKAAAIVVGILLLAAGLIILGGMWILNKMDHRRGLLVQGATSPPIK